MHQRNLKTAVVILLLPLMAFGGIIGFVAGLIIGVLAWTLIERFFARPDWYDHEDEKAGFTRLDLRDTRDSGKK
jgi:hypothetical protein